MQQAAVEPVYTMGYGEEMNRFQARFAQQESMRFLVPRLEPGQRVLDVGCGAGHLSALLARAVAPGVLHGVDAEPSQVELARATAVGLGIGNARFEVADAAELPFEDGSFDVAHLGGVLMHVADVGRVLGEVRRALRPGGLVACRDLMPGSCFVHPELGMMRRSFEAFEDLVAADEGHPQIARDTKLHLLRAGFVDVEVSASFEIYSSPEELDFYYAMVRQWFLEGGVGEAAQECGALSPEMLREVARQLEEWRREPGAVAGTAFGISTAVRP